MVERLDQVLLQPLATLLTRKCITAFGTVSARTPREME